MPNIAPGAGDKKANEAKFLLLWNPFCLMRSMVEGRIKSLSGSFQHEMVPWQYYRTMNGVREGRNGWEQGKLPVSGDTDSEKDKEELVLKIQKEPAPRPRKSWFIWRNHKCCWNIVCVCVGMCVCVYVFGWWMGRGRRKVAGVASLEILWQPKVNY